jgi:hypothetical protein
VAEGAPLLREYAGKTCIKGSNPFDSARTKENAPLMRGVFLGARRCYCTRCRRDTASSSIAPASISATLAGSGTTCTTLPPKSTM